MFKKNDRYMFPDGNVWRVNYEGISCCKNDVVTFDRLGRGKTMNTTKAYNMLADGDISIMGQQELFI